MGENLMSLARSGGKYLKLFGDGKMVKTLPYDAEVEWLGLDYKQGAGPIFKIPLDTSYGDIDFKTEIKVNENCLHRDIKYFGRCTTNARRLGMSQFQSKIRDTTVQITNEWMSINCDATRAVGTITIGSVTNEVKYWWTSGVTSGDLINYLPIFGEANVNSSSSEYVNALGGFAMKFFQIYRDDSLVLDIVFVRKDGCGMAYDKVSGMLFSPYYLSTSETRRFVIGPDKTT